MNDWIEYDSFVGSRRPDVPPSYLRTMSGQDSFIGAFIGAEESQGPRGGTEGETQHSLSRPCPLIDYVVIVPKPGNQFTASTCTNKDKSQEIPVGSYGFTGLPHQEGSGGSLDFDIKDIVDRAPGRRDTRHGKWLGAKGGPLMSEVEVSESVISSFVDPYEVGKFDWRMAKTMAWSSAPE
jgi:hypothetical protein